MKSITICEKQYNIECNALTYISYKKIFNRGIFEDIQIIENFVKRQILIEKEIKDKNPNITDEVLIKKLSRNMLGDIDNYIEAVTRIAYICIYTANENYMKYEDWLKDIKRINTNDKWIVEVTEFAVDCFC